MENNYKIIGNIVLIELKRRKPKKSKWTVIDLIDLEKVRKIRGSWHVRLASSGRTYYVAHDKSFGTKRRTYLYRLICDLDNIDFSLVPDHEDGDGLNNRRNNLRIATQAQNQQNRNGLAISNTSGFNGVCFNKKILKWRVYITVNNVLINLGYYSSILEAVEIRKEAELRYWSRPSNVEKT